METIASPIISLRSLIRYDNIKQWLAVTVISKQVMTIINNRCHYIISDPAMSMDWLLSCFNQVRTKSVNLRTWYGLAQDLASQNPEECPDHSFIIQSLADLISE